MVLCQFLQLPDDMALWISSAVAVGMRFFALRYDICLKAISNHSD
jgi:hypothetical protein